MNFSLAFDLIKCFNRQILAMSKYLLNMVVNIDMLTYVYNNILRIDCYD